VQWTDQARVPIGSVQPVGVFQGVVVEGYDRIDGRALLVVGGDPVEVALDQLPRRELAGFECRMDVVDRRLGDLKRRRSAVLRMAARCPGCQQCAEHHGRDGDVPIFHVRPSRCAEGKRLGYTIAPRFSAYRGTGAARPNTALADERARARPGAKLLAACGRGGRC